VSALGRVALSNQRDRRLWLSPWVFCPAELPHYCNPKEIARAGNQWNVALRKLCKESQIFLSSTSEKISAHMITLLSLFRFIAMEKPQTKRKESTFAPQQKQVTGATNFL
jgi:hypothetical protein